jgi:hypothetical protein
VLTPELTRYFDGAHNGRKVVIRSEIVAIDHSGILKVVARQTDGAFARRLHKGWRDRERVWWRCSKARGYLGCNHR